VSRLAPVPVAVAIVRDGAGRVLMAERTPRQIAAGHWELPGGKIESGESPEQAAERELLEEAGLRAEALRPWRSYDFAFPTRSVRLHFFFADRWSGVPDGREGNRLAWVDPARPAVGPVLPSNRRALALLSLPPVLVKVPLANGAAARLAPAALDGALLLAGGGTPGQRVQFTRRLVERGARVLLEGTPLEARQAGSLGLASPWPDWQGLAGRPPVDLWAVRCASPSELDRAAALGADLAILPAALPGAGGEAALARAPLPVYLDGPAAPDRARALGAAGMVIDGGPVPAALAGGASRRGAGR
jgi:8-oxo-dGTP diphosphatase